jgi:hypothetical protein
MIQFRDRIHKIHVDEILDFSRLVIQNPGFFFDPRFSGTIGLANWISFFIFLNYKVYSILEIYYSFRDFLSPVSQLQQLPDFVFETKNAIP